MADAMHPMAPHHLPGFITPPGQTDVLFTGAIIFFVILVVVIGSLYFRLHALPERIAHGTSHLQFQLVAVLSLLALFTHNNLFWVAALLLALVPVPDFWTPLANMAESLAVLASRRPRPVSSDGPHEPAAEGRAADPALSAEAAHQLPPTEISRGVPSEVKDGSSQTAPPARADNGSPVSEVQDQSPLKSSSDSPHRISPVEGRAS